VPTRVFSLSSSVSVCSSVSYASLILSDLDSLLISFALTPCLLFSPLPASLLYFAPPLFFSEFYLVSWIFPPCAWQLALATHRGHIKPPCVATFCPAYSFGSFGPFTPEFNLEVCLFSEVLHLARCLSTFVSENFRHCAKRVSGCYNPFSH